MHIARHVPDFAGKEAKHRCIPRARLDGPEPQIEIRLPKGTGHRLASAAPRRLAAEVELVTPEREGWMVGTESFHDTRGSVYLELADANVHRGRAGWRSSRGSWGELRAAAGGGQLSPTQTKRRAAGRPHDEPRRRHP
jgi:hypothetical protein